jgi:hypothetical protein
VAARVTSPTRVVRGRDVLLFLDWAIAKGPVIGNNSQSRDLRHHTRWSTLTFVTHTLKMKRRKDHLK